jgi:hypothetical protein
VMDTPLPLVLIESGFVVPHLPDKPQNPIIDGLDIAQKKSNLKVVHSVEGAERLTESDPSLNGWMADTKNLAMSWDTILMSRNSQRHSSMQLSSPFLSEQSPSIFAAAQY